MMATCKKAMGCFVTLSACTMALTGCLGGLTGGGCTIREHVENLQVTPETPCLSVTAGNVNSCGGEYEIQIESSCATNFDIDGKVIAPGMKASLATDTGSSAFCTDVPQQMPTCTASGDLAGSTVTISWDLANGS
jgi:hypothetical protein